eukprot:5019670-Pyramimonas_sp.AAC.1
MLRGVVHSLPNYPAVRLARENLRSRFRVTAQLDASKWGLMGRGGAGKGFSDGGRSGQGGQRGGDRGRDRDLRY